MSKFASATLNLPGRGPTATTQERALTGEGGLGYMKDAKSALFTLGLTNMVGENTFYESAVDRDRRFVDLIRAVAATDPEWLVGFAGWLRDEGNMRSAPVVIAAEAVRAGAPRAIIPAVCKRADEPAELVAYWLANYGRKMPMAFKRGVAAAAVNLYNERSMLRYDSSRHDVRPADVIELTHPKPATGLQSALFKYLLDKRHERADIDLSSLPVMAAVKAWEAMPEANRRASLGGGLPEGVSWERLAGWLPGGMDAEAWEAVIPTMGYMALLRNLRNFEQADISHVATALVNSRLMDPERVAKARLFPYRFYAAWKNSNSMRFASAIEMGLVMACEQIPKFDGRTLVMIDISGSMNDNYSDKSKMARWESAALFGGAIATRSEADVFFYNDRCTQVQLDKGFSVLRFMDTVRSHIGGGTYTWQCVQAAFNPAKHDRIVVLTDEQSVRADQSFIPRSTPTYVWSLAGYRVSDIEVGPNRFMLGGLSDAAFKIVPLLERGKDAGWPWEG